MLVRVKRLAAFVRAQVDLRDVFCFGGLASVGAGVAQIHVPAALIVVGAVLFWLGVKR